MVDVDLLADIPLIDAAGTPREVLALRPFRQVVERGFECHDDEAPLRCLVVSSHGSVPTGRRARGPADGTGRRSATPGSTSPTRSTPAIVRSVIADEIGRGEGANFVIRRDFTAGVDADAVPAAALTWFRALLEHERGAYWTFLVSTPGHIAVGASPEAHVSASDGVVTMNPISGTFRHPAGGADGSPTLTEFLESTRRPRSCSW